MVAQAELWLMETPDNKHRPILVITRDEVIPVLNNVVVAPVTSTVRETPTCIAVGPDEGIDHDSVASFDNLAAVPKSGPTTRLGSLGATGRRGDGATGRRGDGATANLRCPDRNDELRPATPAPLSRQDTEGCG